MVLPCPHGLVASLQKLTTAFHLNPDSFDVKELNKAASGCVSPTHTATNRWRNFMSAKSLLTAFKSWSMGSHLGQQYIELAFALNSNIKNKQFILNQLATNNNS